MAILCSQKEAEDISNKVSEIKELYQTDSDKAEVTAKINQLCKIYNIDFKKLVFINNEYINNPNSDMFSKEDKILTKENPTTKEAINIEVAKIFFLSDFPTKYQNSSEDEKKVLKVCFAYTLPVAMNIVLENMSKMFPDLRSKLNGEGKFIGYDITTYVRNGTEKTKKDDIIKNYDNYAKSFLSKEDLKKIFSVLKKDPETLKKVIKKRNALFIKMLKDIESQKKRFEDSKEYNEKETNEKETNEKEANENKKEANENKNKNKNKYKFKNIDFKEASKALRGMAEAIGSNNIAKIKEEAELYRDCLGDYSKILLSTDDDDDEIDKKSDIELYVLKDFNNFKKIASEVDKTKNNVIDDKNGLSKINSEILLKDLNFGSPRSVAERAEIFINKYVYKYFSKKFILKSEFSEACRIGLVYYNIKMTRNNENNVNINKIAMENDIGKKYTGEELEKKFEEYAKDPKVKNKILSSELILRLPKEYLAYLKVGTYIIPEKLASNFARNDFAKKYYSLYEEYKKSNKEEYLKEIKFLKDPNKALESEKEYQSLNKDYENKVIDAKEYHQKLKNLSKSLSKNLRAFSEGFRNRILNDKELYSLCTETKDKYKKEFQESNRDFSDINNINKFVKKITDEYCSIKKIDLSLNDNIFTKEEFDLRTLNALKKLNTNISELDDEYDKDSFTQVRGLKGDFNLTSAPYVVAANLIRKFYDMNLDYDLGDKKGLEEFISSLNDFPMTVKKTSMFKVLKNFVNKLKEEEEYDIDVLEDALEESQIKKIYDDLQDLINGEYDKLKDAQVILNKQKLISEKPENNKILEKYDSSVTIEASGLVANKKFEVASSVFKNALAARHPFQSAEIVAGNIIEILNNESLDKNNRISKVNKYLQSNDQHAKKFANKHFDIELLSAMLFNIKAKEKKSLDDIEDELADELVKWLIDKRNENVKANEAKIEEKNNAKMKSSERNTINANIVNLNNYTTLTSDLVVEKQVKLDSAKNLAIAAFDTDSKVTVDGRKLSHKEVFDLFIETRYYTEYDGNTYDLPEETINSKVFLIGLTGGGKSGGVNGAKKYSGWLLAAKEGSRYIPIKINGKIAVLRVGTNNKEILNTNAYDGKQIKGYYKNKEISKLIEERKKKGMKVEFFPISKEIVFSTSKQVLKDDDGGPGEGCVNIAVKEVGDQYKNDEAKVEESVISLNKYFTF